MKPIFTIHAGEYLVAAEIEKSFKSITVWLPAKDTGIDLLLTDKANKRTVSLQVKFSKDFTVTHVKENLRPNIKGLGWWTLEREKVRKSQADYWVMILYSFEKKSNDYVIIKPSQLLHVFLQSGRDADRIHSYITVTENGTAFETRGLPEADMQAVCNGSFRNAERNLTKYLNNWQPVLSDLKMNG